MTRRLTYLLHWSHALHPPWHYVGSTTQAQYKKRMGEHKYATADCATEARAKNGWTLEWVTLLGETTERFERAANKSPALWLACGVCNPQKGLEAIRPPFAPKEGESRADLPRLPTNKKGRRRAPAPTKNSSIPAGSEESRETKDGAAVADCPASPHRKGGEPALR